MSDNERKNQTRETKAGLLEKNSPQSSERSTEKDFAESERDPQNKPKISKDEAAVKDTDKPLH